MMCIKLNQLQLDMKADRQDDSVLIYTLFGTHNPQQKLGHICPVASLPCDDVEDDESPAFQIARLFMASPELLSACEVVFARLNASKDDVISDFLDEKGAKELLDAIKTARNIA